MCNPSIQQCHQLYKQTEQIYTVHICIRALISAKSQSLIHTCIKLKRE